MIHRFVSLATVFAGLCIAQVNILTANYDNNRTNANVQETTLNPQSVNSSAFGKIGTFPVDGQIYAQPLYVSGVNIAGQGVRNVVFVATMHDSVYAIDADAPQSTTPLWTVNLGASIPSAVFNFSDIVPEVGILSTPVADPAHNVLYVVSNILANNVPIFQLHALSLSDGSEQMRGPIVVSASTRGTGGGSDGDTLSLDPINYLQRPGLVLTNGNVYLAFGSHADQGNFHGWLIGYSARNLQEQTAAFCTTPNGLGGSIWQSGRAPAINAQGDIFAVTGNGNFDGVSLFGESLLHLSGTFPHAALARGALNLVDWFTPQVWNSLNDDDWDFGSSGAILVPGANQVLAGAKSGMLYLAPTTSLGHLGGEGNGSVQAVQVNQWGLFDMALWNNQDGPIVYELEPANALRAFQISGGQLNATELSEFDTTSFFGGIAVSANGGSNGTGIVWLTTGDSTVSGTPGTLHALDAGNIANEFWNSDMVPDRDTLGRFAKFVPPTVANGRVYVGTFSNALVIYGLLSVYPPGVGSPRVTAVVSGGSFLGNTVAPGEVVAIFGTNLGPAQLGNLQLDSNGNVGNSLAGTQVLFDGVAVPLLYSSSTQVGAVVPFGVNNTSTQVQVVYQGQTSNTLTVPVTAAAPALFSTDGSGGGFGVVNQDGSLNGWSSPASSGSVVTMYVTGVGQMNPPGVDGTVSTAPFAVPVLPLTVYFNGQQGQILYAGAAPGIVAGVVQINAIVPDSMSGDYNVQVTIQAGNSSSPNALTVNVE